MLGEWSHKVGFFWVLAFTVLVLGGISRAARADLTVEKLTANAITGVGPYYQDVADAIKQFGSKNYDAALKHLQSAKKTTPRLAPPEVMMAALYFDANFPIAGIAMLEKAMRSAPDDPEATVILAERAVSEGRQTEAEMLFQKAGKSVESFNENPKRKQDFLSRILTGAASVDEARSDWKEARAKLEALIKHDPRSASAHERLGRVLFNLNDQKKAYAVFQTAAEIDTKVVPAELAMAYLSADKVNAEKWLNFALKKSAGDLRTQIGAANYFLKNNQPEAAKGHAELALQLDPNGFDSNATAGLIERMLGDYKNSEAHLSKAHLMAPMHGGVINNLALVLMELPDEESRQRALQFAELNVKHNANSSEAMSTLGWVNYRLNRRREAERAFTAAVTFPDGTTNRTMTSEMAYYLAHLAKEQGNVPEAIKLLQDALNTELPFAFRKPAEQLLAQLSKADSSQQKTKSDKSPAASKSAEPPGKVGAAK